MATRAWGVCTWTFGDLPLHDVARRVAGLGYQGIELLGDLERYSAREAAGIARDHGLAVFSLTPANVDLAHPEPAVRQAAIAYYLRLLDFAAGVGWPLVACHGYVGRLRPVATMAEEWDWLVAGVRQVGQAAAGREQKVVFEVLNRYESHLVNTAVEARALVEAVGLANVGILLDAYHMNIEEAEPAAAIRTAGDRLWLYHAADSNRQGLGRGHTRFESQRQALDEIGYGGPIIVECTAPGPDPFAPIKGQASLDWLQQYLRDSLGRI